MLAINLQLLTWASEAYQHESMYFFKSEANGLRDTRPSVATALPKGKSRTVTHNRCGLNCFSLQSELLN
jgi:hypothetical protein